MILGNHFRVLRNVCAILRNSFVISGNHFEILRSSFPVLRMSSVILRSPSGVSQNVSELPGTPYIVLRSAFVVLGMERMGRATWPVTPRGQRSSIAGSDRETNPCRVLLRSFVILGNVFAISKRLGRGFGSAGSRVVYLRFQQRSLVNKWGQPGNVGLGCSILHLSHRRL